MAEPRESRGDGADPIVARAAIAHDWFQGYHGAERAVDVLRTDVFASDAPPDVFTFYAARDVIPPDLAASIVRESRLGRLPWFRQKGHDPGHWRLLVPYMPYYFDHLKLDAYDVVVSSSHAFATNVRTRPDALHVCYCYTPIRYVWLPTTDERRMAGIARVALGALRGRLRQIDLAASKRPDAYVAISSAVRDRIRAIYGRDAEVVPPPVDVGDFDPTAEKERETFLWVHRLVDYKRPELVVEAFRGLPYRLTMVGVGPLEERVRAALPPNVELLGWLPREELARRLSRAAGFVHVAEEDFGISMVEALAAGTPVIALGRGGALDIVRPGVDGILIEEATEEELRHAVRSVATEEWSPRELAARAASFSREAFAARMRSVLREAGATRGLAL